MELQPIGTLEPANQRVLLANSGFRLPADVMRHGKKRTSHTYGIRTCTYLYEKTTLTYMHTVW